MEKLIWQPTLTYKSGDIDSYNFSVEVDREFAKIMRDAIITGEKKKMMNELASERIRLQGFNQQEPYRFYEESGLVTSFHINDGKGVWLSMGTNRDMKFEENPVYYSSNVDTSKDAIVLMQLVSLWAEYGEALRGE